MRLPALIAWLLGIGLLAGLVALNDPAEVFAGIGALRLWLPLVILFHAVPLFFDIVAWQRLFTAPPSLMALFRIRWIAEGMNGLFPVPHLGELLRADLARRLTSGGDAGASVVVDVTLGVATQILFAAFGLALFSVVSRNSPLLRALFLAMALLTVSAGVFYLLQRAGMFTLAAAVVRRWSGAARRVFDMDDARALDGRVRALYGRRDALFSSAIWRLAGWMAGAGEGWLILYGLGHPVGLVDAIILESLSQAARTAAFAIPGGLGVQDGALLVLCTQLGLGAEVGLALSLTKRCRELVLGLPALSIGYVIQARRVAATGGWRDEPPPA
jgi:putative membrane protein